MGTKEEDWVEHLFLASTHDYLLIFTTAGRMYWLKVYQIPLARRTARGKPVVNLLSMAKGEKIASIVRAREFSADRFLIFATRRGLVKKTSLAAYRNVRAPGLRAINILEDDRLIDVKLSDGSNDVLLATRRGRAIRFSEGDVREVGRIAQGVRGIRLQERDTVVGMVVARRGGSLLTATDLGIGKRSNVTDYRLTRRAAQGVINLKITARSGEVAAIREVTDDDELMFVTRNGVINRQRAEEIRVMGRNTQGVRLVSLDEGDELMDVACLIDPIGADETENDELVTEGAGGADAGATAEIEDAE